MTRRKTILHQQYAYIDRIIYRLTLMIQNRRVNKIIDLYTQNGNSKPKYESI